VLRELFNDLRPCLVLIDEWVAYARQLHDQSDLPAGSFETQFSFAQALTESAKLAGNCLLVISLPASDTSGSPHSAPTTWRWAASAGARRSTGCATWSAGWSRRGGRRPPRRASRSSGGGCSSPSRTPSSSSSATSRRGRSPISTAPSRPSSRPSAGGDYEQRIQAAYPIHPEIFDQLYGGLVDPGEVPAHARRAAPDGGGDPQPVGEGRPNPLILPSTIPIDDPRVQFELTRYLSDNWAPIIEKDVDGPSSLPLRSTASCPTSASSRPAGGWRAPSTWARPDHRAAHRGLEDRASSSAASCRASRRPSSATPCAARLEGHLPLPGRPRYWYSTQPTVTKLAEDRAEQLRRDPDKVAEELEKRLRDDLRHRGDFARVHAGAPSRRRRARRPGSAPGGARRSEHPYSKEPATAAETAAKAILECAAARRACSATRSCSWRPTRCAPGPRRGGRRFLAWSSILAEREALNLDPHQVRQAETQLQAADSTVTARLPETYQWLLVPEQPESEGATTWEAYRLTGAEALAVRASKRLEREELLLKAMGSTILRKHMDRIPLWSGDHVDVRQLADHFARYLYLPRLAGPDVLLQAIREGVGLLTWETETFAYAEGYDEEKDRYRGLRGGNSVMVTREGGGCLVKPDRARRQFDAEVPKPSTRSVGGEEAGVGGGQVVPPDGNEDGAAAGGSSLRDAAPRRYYGTVSLDPQRVGFEASRIADEVIVHLAGLVGSKVAVTLEIAAEIPEGVPEQVVRTVTENGRTLRFENQGFETE
jgi:hypothetical protein